MDNETTPYFDIHIFCCINRRADGHNRGCCASKGSEKLRKYMKDKVKKVAGERNIRVNNSGCLDRCEEGPVMVIYPEGVWYNYQSKDDVDEIVQTHLVEGNVVTHLQI